MDLGLQDKKVFITASTDGIGKATAECFLKEGASVFLNGRSVEKLEQCIGNFRDKYGEENVDGIAGDSSQIEIVQSAVKLIEKKWGNLDILIGNLGKGKPISKDRLNLKEWNHMLEQNLLSSVMLLQEFNPILAENAGGSIVLMSSLAAGNRIGAPWAYAAAKSGIVSLIRYSCEEYAKRGIRINGVSPGNIYYEGGRWQELEKKNPKQVKEYLEKEVPMKRFGTPHEIASAIVFLSSDKSTFTTGEILTVDGGQKKGY